MDHRSLQVVRFVLAFSWVYQGVFPKLLTVAPLEKALTATIGLSPEHSCLLTKFAGVSEVLFGLALFFLYKNKPLLIFNIVALTALALFVAIQMPSLLIEAFNPVTTNLPLIVLSYVLLRARHL